MTRIFLIAAIFVLTACGGGGTTGSANQAPVIETPKPPEILLGGTPSAPTFLGLDSKNAIDTNTFNNYFKYASVAGERLVIHVNLSNPLSDVEKARCGSNSGTGATPSSYASQIHVYSSNNVRIDGICGEDLTYVFPQTALYIFNFEFPTNGPGFFNAASLKGDAPVKFLDVGVGSPVEPKKLNTTSVNSIGANVFFNYYWISAIKGETIIVNTVLNQPLSVQQKTRCGDSGGTGAYSTTQIRIYNSTLSKVGYACGESIRFEVPESGNYVLQFDYGSQSAGIFNAAKV